MSSPKPLTLNSQLKIPNSKTTAFVRGAWRYKPALAILLCTLTAHATLPDWLQHIVGASSLDAALFRAMPLPQVPAALYPRPPKEAQTELAHLINATPDDDQLYALRAQTDESALDFLAAEADWKLFVAHAKDPIAARLELANFYQRRLMTAPELATLSDVASAPPIPAEQFENPTRQRSWRAFERILALIDDQALPAAETSATYQKFLTRYPDQPAVYARFLDWQLSQQQWSEAEALIARFQKAFPADREFPIRAQALLDFRRGNIDQALAVYDRSFEPLWPAGLVQSYYALLSNTHRARAMVAEARTQLAQHPDGPQALNALSRIFFYDQQAGHLDKAQQTLDAFRIARERRNGAWTAVDLYTLATLSTAIHNYPEAARYNYALASMPGNIPDGEPAAQAGLTGLIQILLDAPDQPIALGAGNLTLYRDIATLDQGPGYWNGILSLWLNGTSPQTEYNTETAKAQGYFHRAKAAELLTQLDQRFPTALDRAALHAQMIHLYAQYGESDAVIAAGKAFLADFPNAPNRVDIANLMADAYARQKDTSAEFALYDTLLTEPAAKARAQTNGLPLSAATANVAPSTPPVPIPDGNTFDLNYTPITHEDGDSYAYAAILDRYLGRLVAEKQLPQALAVLRRQLDQNPNDPQLYEKLATFLGQNNLSQQEEDTYKLALARFPDTGWYDKLARLYLRERRREDFVDLTHQVTAIFSGTDLDRYFASVGTLREFDAPNQANPGRRLAVELNLYAQQRFPHDLVFTRNLLNAYRSGPIANPVAYEALLRHHWWESDDLRQEFFAFLARTGKLQSELAALNNLPGAPPSAASSLRVGEAAPTPGAPSQSASSIEVGSNDSTATSNPAAARELAELQIWSSHFESAAPLIGSVANLYPADPTVGDQTVSLYRSLAYLDPTPASTRRAVAVESNLLAANPADANRLATLGDLYAEATSTGGEDLAAAAPYWSRIPTLHPGTPAGYLTSATIFWDYFQFSDAMAELTAARTRFHQPALFGYEAGAIAENQRDLPAAIAEYVAVAIHPPDDRFFHTSVDAAVNAFKKPPSDTADSNLQSTAQSIFNSAAARTRLLQLAARPATAPLVDKATAQAAAATLTPIALTLRADVLSAQHRPGEIAPLLNQAIDRAATVDQAAAIGELARTQAQSLPEPALLNQVTVNLDTGATARRYTPAAGFALTAVYEHALTREIALSTDPVQKIELSYTLSASLEAHKDIPAATRIIDSVYRANPRILGVVRATTDFYARTSQPPRAIATLLEAAKAATPELARNFTLEAAQKANDSGDTAQARKLAEQLLPQTPYDATVLGIIAASYARANDDAGLKAFYLAQLNSVKTAQLSAEARKSDTALLRRGLIPALTRLRDYEGATDQYIALLSAYPKDSSTAQEAALYALRYNRQPQLLDFLRTTTQQSPKDSRFAILLAQVETTFDDLPAAVAAYDRAIAIRKDRTDLYAARVDLELRLGLADPTQFDRATGDFDRLYILSYKDSSWMVRLAELRARQQRPADAVKALTTAYIAGQPPSAANNFRVADQLAQWNLLTEARTFAQQGVTLAGSNLLTNADGNGPATYARILTRLGRPDEALDTLTRAFRAVDTNTTLPPELEAMYAKSGISPRDLDNARRNYIQTRRDTARNQLHLAVAAIGSTVQTFYTPEQKLAYAHTLDQLHDSGANPQLAIDAATAAGLADREAAFRRQQLLTSPVTPPPDTSAFIALETRRLAFPELAQTLEAFAQRVNPQTRTGVLTQAAQAWRNAGDETNELRVTRLVALRDNSQLRDRFLDLLLRHDRAALIALAASKDDSLADAAANFAVAHASEPQALAAVSARSRSLPPVWRPAVSSLVLTNFAAPNNPPTPALLADFTQPLNTEATIAQRLATPADPSRQLTGDQWFYYATRYGLFLAASSKAPNNPGLKPDPDDFLVAELEQAPTSPAGYLHLARNYADLANYPAAITEYNHALELAPNNPSVHDDFAVVLYRANHHDEALAHWKTALALLAKRQSGEPFFTTFQSVVFHLAQRKLFAAERPGIEAVLRPYFQRNGNYRSNELLEAVYTNAPTPAEGTALILTTSTFASDPNQVLEDLSHVTWLTPEAREAILLRQIELARNKPSDDASSAPAGYQEQLIEFYLDRNELAKAQALFDSMPGHATHSGDMDRIILATRQDRLAPLLDTWRNQPDTIPDDTAFGSALYRLRKSTPAYTPSPAAIRPLEEFYFDHKQLTHTLQPTDFLALAQTRLDTNDLPGALELLHRLTLQPVSSYENGSVSFPGARPTPAEEEFFQNEPAVIQYRGDQPVNFYANTDYAAALLESSHHYAEAIPFLITLTQAVPWNPTYRLRLAEAQLHTSTPASASETLTALLRDSSAPYSTRVKAAQDFASIPNASLPKDLPSAELTLLALNTTPGPQLARQPYFLAARLAAAAAPSLAKADRSTLLREAIALAPNAPIADRARLDLLLTQTATDSASATLAIFAPLSNMQQDYNFHRREDQEAGTPDTASDAEPADGDASPAPSETEDPRDGQQLSSGPDPTFFPFHLPITLDRPTQIRLAVLLASAYNRDHNPGLSLFYDKLAVNIDAKNPTPDPVVIKRLADFQAAQRLEARNALRRPLIHNDLDQPNLVRPRLTLADQARAEDPQ